jgi:hypothetical protein
MGTTSYAVNDAMAVKLWSRVLDHEALKYTDIAPLIGDDENSIIHRQDALSKGPGDQITYAIVMQLAQAPRLLAGGHCSHLQAADGGRA